MIRKSQISFDGHAQVGGSIDEMYLNEELLDEKDAIQVINAIYFRLPFRLKLGRRTVFDVTGVVPARIIVINFVDIPNIEKEKKIIGNPPKENPDFASNVLIILKPKKLKNDFKAKIKKCFERNDTRNGSINIPDLYANPEDAMKPLNKLIVLYRVLFGEDIRFNRVRNILRKDISNGSICHLHLFKKKDKQDNFQYIENSIKDARPQSSSLFKAGGHLFDIPTEKVKELQRQLIQSTHYGFYSLYIQSEDYVKQTDYLNALLYAVIAFENAHSEFIEYIAEKKAGCEKAREWAQDMLREAGISAMVKLTPVLFMEIENRPSNKIIDDVVRAIQIRNQLAHAKRDKNRNLKIDSYNSNDLMPLIVSLLSYINTIARQLPD